MKAYIFVFALAIVAHAVYADWKEDLLNERVDKLANFVTQQIDVLKKAVEVYKKGEECVDSATTQFETVLSEARTQLEVCVNQNDDESEAQKCCDSQEAMTVFKMLPTTTSALGCIYNS